MDVMHAPVKRLPVQQPVRPVEPGIVQVVQRHDRGKHVEHLSMSSVRGSSHVDESRSAFSASSRAWRTVIVIKTARILQDHTGPEHGFYHRCTVPA